jgi:hypothetical protein
MLTTWRRPFAGLDPGQEADEAVDHAAEVDPHDPVVVVVARLVGRAEHRDAGVVDQHVDLAEVPLDLVCHFGEARAVGHVELAEQRLRVALAGEPLRGVRPVVLVAVAQRELHPGVGKRLRHAEPDPRHRAGNEGNAPFPRSVAHVRISSRQNANGRYGYSQNRESR